VGKSQCKSSRAGRVMSRRFRRAHASHIQNECSFFFHVSGVHNLFHVFGWCDVLRHCLSSNACLGESLPARPSLDYNIVTPVHLQRTHLAIELFPWAHTVARAVSEYAWDQLPFSTRRLFVTANTLGTEFARIPATSLSASLFTTPSSVTRPLATTM
jgi:hypothetical protein